MTKKERAAAVTELLKSVYPEAVCATIIHLIMNCCSPPGFQRSARTRASIL